MIRASLDFKSLALLLILYYRIFNILLFAKNNNCLSRDFVYTLLRHFNVKVLSTPINALYRIFSLSWTFLFFKKMLGKEKGKTMEKNFINMQTHKHTHTKYESIQE